MRKIFIEDIFFTPGSGRSGKCLSSIKKISDYGYEIFLSKSLLQRQKYLKWILKSEGIKYKVQIKKDDALIIGKEYKDLKSAADRLCGGRCAVICRKTGETEIKIKLDLDGTGKGRIDTGIGFFDHMLGQLARHANLDLTIDVKGDLNVDEHHTVEDTGITLGEALAKALGEKKGIRRYGFFIPMDESLSLCTIDLSGRSYVNFSCEFNREYVGGFPTELTGEFFRALSSGMKANIYIKAKGENDHHKIESVFKAFAKSLNEACRFDERNKNRVPSTKGIL